MVKNPNLDETQIFERGYNCVVEMNKCGNFESSMLNRKDTAGHAPRACPGYVTSGDGTP